MQFLTGKFFFIRTEWIHHSASRKSNVLQYCDSFIMELLFVYNRQLSVSHIIYSHLLNIQLCSDALYYSLSNGFLYSFSLDKNYYYFMINFQIIIFINCEVFKGRNIHSGKFQPVRYGMVRFLLFSEYISSYEQEIYSENKRKWSGFFLIRTVFWSNFGFAQLVFAVSLNFPISVVVLVVVQATLKKSSFSYRH